MLCSFWVVEVSSGVGLRCDVGGLVELVFVDDVFDFVACVVDFVFDCVGCFVDLVFVF